MEEKLKEEIAHLKELLEGQEVSAKMLVRRDLELSRANTKLRALEQKKSEFISIVAHQLRTPLSVTKWAFDILSEDAIEKLTPEERNILAKGKESNERMITLVNDLLHVDLHESGKIDYAFVDLEFAPVIQEVVEELALFAAQKEMTLNFNNLAQNIVVCIDKERMQAVLKNLVENAIRYTSKGGEVHITLEQQSDTAVVAIKDEGIGIPKEERDHLFSKFHRAQNAVEAATEGSGLGLFISRKIVKRHGGEIWFESGEGKGTIFFFSVPLKCN